MATTSRRLALIGLFSGALAVYYHFRQLPHAPRPKAEGPTPPTPPTPPATPPLPVPATATAAPAVTPNTHDNPVSAWAFSPSNGLLATGAEADFEHADDPVEGVVLWDITRAEPKVRVRVPGGVGLCDQLRRGIRFSSDGALVAINGHTNGVFVAKTDSGELLAEVYLTGSDGPPQALLSEDGESLFVEDYGEQHIGGVVPARYNVPAEQVRWLPARSGTLHPVKLTPGALFVVEDGVLRSISREDGSVTDLLSLMDGHRVAARSGRLLAVAGDGVFLADLDAETPLSSYNTFNDVEDFAFSTGSDRVLALVQAHGQRPARATLLSAQGTLRPIDRNLTRIDWLSTPDFLPAALSPDGAEALLLGDAGAVERWGLDPEPAPLASVGRWSGLRGVLWPTPERAVLIGPTLLVFLEMPSGKVLRTVGFPPGDD